MVNGLFLPGTPVAAPHFLSEVCTLFNADAAAVVVSRVDPKRPFQTTLDSVLHRSDQLGSEIEGFFDSPRWEHDPVARVLQRRIFGHPQRAFTFSYFDLAGGYHEDDERLFGGQLLRSAGWTADRGSVLWADRSTVSTLSVYRNERFNREEAHLLASVHEILRDRVIEIRGHRLREELPASIRATFSLLLSGQTEKEIARMTHRSPNTVHDHVKRIYQHFNVGSRAQLLARFVDVDRLNGHRL